MTRYLISFGTHAMDHIPEMPAVAKASHEVVQEAINAGVWVSAAASDRRRPATLEQDLPWRRPGDAGLRIDLN